MSHAQSIIFVDLGGLYEVVDNTCTYVNLNQTCMVGAGVGNPGLFSVARFKDTIYILTINNEIYRTTINDMGSCTLIKKMPTFIPAVCLCADKTGMIYGISDKQLYRLDPHTTRFDIIGNLPIAPSGDMVFYHDTLLYASGSGIIAVDMNSPGDSKIFMGVGSYIFYGLVSLPVDCKRNKLYGISSNAAGFSDLVEMDPETKTIIGPTCSIPYNVLDAASIVEDGTTLGVTIDSLFLQSPCGNETIGSMQAFAYTAANGGLTYTLDGNRTNQTGIFDNLTLGSHTLHVVNASGCMTDSTFTLTMGLSNALNTQLVNPADCYQLDGSIDVFASTGTPPLLYSMNHSTPQTDPHFGGLNAGSFLIEIVDGGHCQKDLTVSLKYKKPVTFLDRVDVTPSLCQTKNGTIAITFAAGVNPLDMNIQLNNVTRSQNPVTGLDVGDYTLSVISTQGCRYDTLINVPVAANDEPAIGALVKDPLCYPDDANIKVSVSGLKAPYQTSIDHTAWGTDELYGGLSEGRHILSVMDKDGCAWDTAVIIKPFIKDLLSAVDIDSLNPDCRTIGSGWVSIQVDGANPPYLLRHDGIKHTNGSRIMGLNNGDQDFLIINKNGCIVDTVHMVLDLQMMPGCDTFYMPNAFTPNGDGTNDVFRPLHSPYLTNYQLSVYNNWGQLVFSGNDVNKGWNGLLNGHAQPPGAYVWTIRYENFERQPKFLKGMLYLVR